VVPVIVAGWFYYKKGGAIAGFLAFFVNLMLVVTFGLFSNSGQSGYLPDGFLLGHVLIILIGILIGFIRLEVEKEFISEKQLRNRDQQLSKVSMIVNEILEREFGSQELYFKITSFLVNLFVANYGFLIICDENSHDAVLVSNTLSSDHLVNNILNQHAKKNVENILENGHILFLNDVRDEKLLDPTFFNNLDLSPRSIMAIPFSTRDYQFGVMFLGFHDPRQFDRNEIASFELISTQITLALRNIQQEQKINKQLNEAKVLAKIEKSLSENESIGVDIVLQNIVNAVQQIIPNAKQVVLHLLEEDEEENVLIPRAVAGYKKGSKKRLRMHHGEGIAGRVIETGEMISIDDVRVDPRFIQKTIQTSIRALAVVPILHKERNIGTISIHSEKERAFSSTEIDLLGRFGTQVAIAIENARLLESTLQDAKEINALYHLARNMNTFLEPEDLLRETVTFLQKSFNYYHIQIYLLEGENGNLIAQFGDGVIGNKLSEDGFTVLTGSGIVGYVAEMKDPFFTNNVNNVINFIYNPKLPDTKSEMCLPIKTSDKFIGVLDIHEKPPKSISLRQMKLMNTVADQLAITLHKINLYKELQSALDHEKNMRIQLLQNERLALVGRLLASVSHELNNPLQAIQNSLFLLNSEENLSTQGKLDMEIILSEVDRITSLIGRLRATYRPSRDDDFQNIDLNVTVEDVHELVTTHMRHKNIAFEFFPYTDLPPILGNPDQIRQVVLNLFLNAIEAMQLGGTLIVQTEILPEQEGVLLSVTDTGTGISPKILPHIFDPFITDKDDGTGLGLSITYDIIKQHDGEIMAENNPEGGATFKVWFPV